MALLKPKRIKPMLLKVGQVKIDKELYPRYAVNWVTSAKYYNALKSGSVFPPITVAKLNNEFILVDGAHRLKAHKDSKETHISAEVLIGLSEEEIYKEAVRRNSIHGQQFSSQEVVQICLTLEKWGESYETISELVHIPVDKLQRFIAERVVKNGDTQEDIVLKSPIKNLPTIDMEGTKAQRVFVNRTQIGILDGFIALLQHKWLDTSSEVIAEKLELIKKLIKDY